MIIEEGKRADFKRCLIDALPRLPYVGEMWKVKSGGYAQQVGTIASVDEDEVIFNLRENRVMSVLRKDFLAGQHNGKMIRVEARFLSAWE